MLGVQILKGSIWNIWSNLLSDEKLLTKKQFSNHKQINTLVDLE